MAEDGLAAYADDLMLVLAQKIANGEKKTRSRWRQYLPKREAQR